MANIKLPKNKVIIGLIAGFLVVIILVISWSLLSRPAERVEPDVTDKTTVEESHLDAVALADKGDVDGALERYDRAIEESSDDAEKKRVLLLHKATLARQSERADIAIDAARQADKIEPDATTAQTLATAYELKGDKENAVIYYKKLIELTPEDSPGTRYIGLWQAKIEELEQ